MIKPWLRGASILWLVALSACSGSGVSQDDLDAATSRADAAEAELEDARESITELESQLESTQDELEAQSSRSAVLTDDKAELQQSIQELQGQAETLESQLSDARSDLIEAETELSEAANLVEELLLAYDPEIQAAKQALQAAAIPTACQTAQDAAAAGNRAPSVRDVLTELADSTPTAGFTPQDLVDSEVIQAEIIRCFEEAALQAVLYSPHPSGFHTVGDEIGPGVWRSTGNGDGCYWERLRGLSGEFDDIITNYFGNAGVTVRISASDVAFSSSGCGTWEYVGP